MSKANPETAAWLSLVAYVRHVFTDYDDLRDQGYDEESARFFVAEEIETVLGEWGVRRPLGGAGLEDGLKRPAPFESMSTPTPARSRTKSIASPARHALPVTVVANGFIRVPQDPLIERVAAGAGMDAADDWIAERAGAGDIVITADVPLATAASRPAPR